MIYSIYNGFVKKNGQFRIKTKLARTVSALQPQTISVEFVTER